MDNNVVDENPIKNDFLTTNRQQENSEGHTFWKNSGRLVPGRPSPSARSVLPFNSASIVGSFGIMSAFRNYQDSVSDAWDTGDDEFCIITNANSAAKSTASLAGNGDEFYRKTKATIMKTTSANNFTNNDKSQRDSQIAPKDVIETHRICNHKFKVNNQSLNNFNNNNNSNKYPETTNTLSQNEADDEHHKLHDNENVKITQMPKYSKHSDEHKRRFRHIVAFPGRPQLQRITSNSKDTEYETKIEKFRLLFESELLDLVALKKLSWSGVPKKMRAISWRLLSKYLPPSGERRSVILQSKRQGYQDLRLNYFKVDSQDESQQDTYRQIHIDVPRMNPQIALFQQKLVQEIFERILFIWSIRHPASGYVQGINDLVTPFFIVFLQEVLEPGTDIEKFDISLLTEETRNFIEADSFWCLSKFLDCIQDNYIFAQLGIQEKVNQLKDLIQRIDGTLHRHLQTHGVDYLQFSFRWMNNLLTRELPLHCTIRLWDTYLAESDGFAIFHLYVCAAFLLHWKEQLMQQNDFQGLLLLLQNLPTHNWCDRQINVLVAEAFRLKFTYADAPKHFEAKS